MAQAMIDFRNLKKDCSTQTVQTIDFSFNLTKSKSVRLYQSKSYKDYVLSLNLGKSKKFIITKQMWKVFRKFLPYFDRVLNYGE